MRLALNGATIMPSPIEGDITIASACGYAALEIWAGKLDAYLAQGLRLEALARHMAMRGIVPWCINSVEDITSRDRAAVLHELRHRAGMARILGAPSIVVVPGHRNDGAQRSEAITEAADVLRSMSDVAGDVALAFEFLGKPGCSVSTLDMAIEIVERVDRANVGIVIDTFHFYAGGSSLDDLERAPIDRLFVVHINGCEDRPKPELTDAHRLYPGEGVTPALAILQRLRARGYDGVASVEIFRPEYWERDPAAVARTAHERSEALLRDAGYLLEAGGTAPA